MRTLKLDNTEFKIPKSWNEVSPETLVFIAALCENGIPKQELLVKTFLFDNQLKVIPNNNRNLLSVSHGKTEFVLTSDILNQLANCYSFLLKDNTDGNYHLNPILIKPLPSFNINGITYYSPADALTNISLHEFIFCETYFHHYTVKDSSKYLDLLIATIYRPERENYKPEYGDRRAIFNDFVINDRAAKIESLPTTQKQVIKWFYEGSCAHLHKKFPHVFNTGSSASGSNDVFEGFIKLVNVLASNDITKTDKVRESNLYEALINFEEMIIRNTKK